MQIIRTTVWTKYDSRIRTDELSAEQEMDENDEGEIRRRTISKLSNGKNDGKTLEMTERKKSDVAASEEETSSRIPLMIEQHNNHYTTNMSSSSNDSSSYLNQGTHISKCIMSI